MQPMAQAISGRIPPQALDMEQAVLGAILLSGDAWERVENVLRVEMFYKEGNRIVFRAMEQLVKSGNPIDLLTVSTELRKAGTLDSAGGSHYLTELISKVANTSNIEYHCRVIAQKFLLREMIKIGDEMVITGYDAMSDVFEVLDKSSASILKLYEQGVGRVTVPLSSHMPEWLKQLKFAQEFKQLKGGMAVVGLSTGLSALDIVTEGLLPGNFYGFGARPGMGKTMVLITMALANAMERINVGFFSLEMTLPQLTARICANLTRMNSKKIRAASLNEQDWAKMLEASQHYCMNHILIDYEAEMTTAEFKRRATYMVRKQGVKLILLDYLQLLRIANPTKFSTDQTSAKEASAMCKELSKTLNVPIVAMIQLNRSVDSTANKRAVLSDFRDAGNIEQDLAFAAFLFRPAYYSERGDDPKEVIRKAFYQMSEEDYKRLLLITIAKQRDGDANITVPANIDLAHSDITDIKSQRWINSIGNECQWMLEDDVIQRLGLEDDRNPGYQMLYQQAEVVSSKTNSNIIPTFDRNGNPIEPQDNEREADFPF